MICHESHYAGFSASAPPKRYKTIPRPANRFAENVRTLRPAVVDDGNAGEVVAEAATEESSASLDGYTMAAIWWIAGWFLYQSDMFLYWAGITVIAMLCTQKYARQWVVSLAILLLIKSYLLP